MSKKTHSIPDGYFQDAQGRLVPEEMVKDIDKQRNAIVLKIVNDAKQVRDEIVKFKSETLEQIEEFIRLSGKQYQVKVGGKKGNVTLQSYDGKYKVQRAISEYIVFDERLQVAKQLIDDCIHAWTEGSRSEIQVLINDAFQVDKEGRVSTTRILGLKRLDINDRKWQKAMRAISDSMQVAGSKTYVRIYERVGNTDEYRPITLDVAAL